MNISLMIVKIMLGIFYMRSDCMPLRRTILAGTSLIALAATAIAQDQTTASPTENGAIVLDKIVIDGGSGGVIDADGYVARSSATGAKIDTPFVQTPQSISSVTQQQLEDRNPQTLLDAIAYTPSARVGGFGFDPRFDSFTVRGFDVTYTGVFRDNLRQPGASSALFKTEPYGLEGVSILRGPSSALYGASGAGGLFNLISKRPTETPLHEVQVQYGTNNRYQTQFDLSGPVKEGDPLYYRLTGLWRNADTEQPSVPDDRIYIAPAFTWKPDEDTRLTILSEFSRIKTGGTAAYYYDAVTGKVSDIFAGNTAFNDSVQTQGRVGYEFETRLNDTFVFRQNARLASTKIGADWAFAYQANEIDPLLLDSSAGTFEERLTSFTIDNQLEASFDTGNFEHTLLAGVDLTKLQWKGLNGYGYTPPLDTRHPSMGRPVAPIDFQTKDVQDQLIAGIYLQDQIRYDAWTITLGGRQDWVTTDTKNTDLATSTSSDFDQSDKAFTWRAGLTYETPWGITPYASYSTAFSPNAGVNRATGNPFEPTESEQQEVGIKYQLPNSNTLITAALFNINQDNGLYYEVVELDAGPANIQVQRGKLRSRGLELEASTSLDNGLSLIASYSYMQTSIKDGPDGTVGNEISSVPTHMASAWAHYKLPENSFLYGLGVGAGVRFVGSSYGNDENTMKNSSRAFVDAAIDFDFGAIKKDYEGVKLQVNATNLFDTSKPVCSAGFCYRDQGRTVVGSLKYSW